MLYGAFIGDIVGSRFEFTGNKSKDFDFFSDKCSFTDDTVMTLAVWDAVSCEYRGKNLENDVIKCMQRYGRKYPNAGYGAMFSRWLESENPKPYNSYGNGAAMRVSACAYFAYTLFDVLELTDRVTKVTHNHPEGIKGARAIATAIFLALHGYTKYAIKAHITDNYYPLDFTLDQIRPTYSFDETCQGSVPQALQAFFEGDSFEDCVRLAVSLGGDADTLGAMTGAIAGAFYEIPNWMIDKMFSYLPPWLSLRLEHFVWAERNEQFSNWYERITIF